MDPSDYPPRYREGEGHNRLILDEPEWLTRPADWGIDLLPEETRSRKIGLYHEYWRARYFSPVLRDLQCSVCKNLIWRLVSSERDNLEDLDQREFPHLTQYRAFHPRLEADEECDAKPFFKRAVQFSRGIMCRSEAINSLIEVVEDRNRKLPWQERNTIFTERKAWERWLALELVGPNPFRPIAFDPTWRTEVVTTLARLADESAEFGNLPVLADALEEAGCDVPEILTHLRGPGPHVRGCWVVDLALGSE